MGVDGLIVTQSAIYFIAAYVRIYWAGDMFDFKKWQNLFNWSLTPIVSLRVIEMNVSRTDLKVIPLAMGKSHEERLNDHFDKILDDLLAA